MAKQKRTQQTAQAAQHTATTGRTKPLVDSTKQPLPSIDTFCRSKTFIANTGVNDLVASASALFSLMGKLANTPAYENLDDLRDNLIHEIKAFECAAHTRGFSAQQILVARYAVCVTLDNIICQQGWCEDWSDNNLLQFFQGEQQGSDRFFLLIERMGQDPHTHIALLEFVYMCLSLGFDAITLDADNPYQALRQVQEDIYRHIRRVRGDFPRKLAMPYKYFQAMASQRPRRSVPVWATCLASMLILGGVYFGMHYLADVTSAPLQQTLIALASDDHETIS